MHAAKKATRASMGVFRLWTTDSSTFPVLMCAGVAAIGCVCTAARAIVLNPDVRVDRTKRRNALAFNADDVNDSRAKRFKYADDDRNEIHQST